MHNERIGSYWFEDMKKSLLKEQREQQKQKERFFGKRKDNHTYGKIKR